LHPPTTGAYRHEGTIIRYESRRTRPVLLLLVYGALLVIVGATAAGQAALISSQSQSNLLNSTVNADAALVRAFLDYARLTPADLSPASVSAERSSVMSAGLEVLTESGQILQAAVVTTDGTIVVGSEPSLANRRIGSPSDLATAVQGGAVDAVILDTAQAGSVLPLPTSTVLREYLPIMSAGTIQGVVVVWRDAAPLLAMLDQGRLEVVLITLSAAFICAVLLYLMFRSAQQRLSRQTVQLLEAARRDPLTGAFNHGAIVEALAASIAATAGAHGARGIGVGLLDVDNFTLLNETYGHEAGDRALTEVAALLDRLAPSMHWGRYGADEFLVIADGDDAIHLEPLIESMRAALADMALEFQSSERLPVTVSVGIAFYPTNGESVTTLLSVLAMTLDEAKASGGDVVRVADVRSSEPSYARTFDVLEGLIIAVDTKDRYTRRHSEDVARYADFVAELMDLDAETRQALHTAGLLHDIGKIGIPDHILRKPGALTDEEYAIVQQHVALGDMIVRDLPNLELIRSGIRHHHERWDGKGYLHRLEGEDIPLIARILAVGDAFSAMTTTRPYRKALSVDEALRRLEDAAGTQLDEAIVGTFVGGIRGAADPPLPGSRPATLWTPTVRVA